MPILKNRTIILINVLGVAILLGMTAAILWKASPEAVGTHGSAFPWTIFTVFIVLFTNRMNAKRRKNAQMKASGVDEDRA